MMCNDSLDRRHVRHFSPIWFWQIFLVHHCPCHLEYVSVLQFGYSILLRCVSASKLPSNAFLSKGTLWRCRRSTLCRRLIENPINSPQCQSRFGWHPSSSDTSFWSVPRDKGQNYKYLIPPMTTSMKFPARKSSILVCLLIVGYVFEPDCEHKK